MSKQRLGLGWRLRSHVWSWLTAALLIGSSLAEPITKPEPLTPPAPPPLMIEPPSTPDEPSSPRFEPPAPAAVEETPGVRLSNTATSTNRPPAARPKPAATPARSKTGSAKSIVLEQRRVRGVDVKIVRVNLWDKDVFISPILPAKGLGKGGEKFDRLVAGSSAVAIINGGYFHPRSYSLAGDLVKNGKHLATQGPVRTALAITPDNRVSVKARPRGGTLNWHEFETAISNGPWVLRGGQVMVIPRDEGYSDRAIERPAARSAVGITSERKMFLVSTRRKINLFDLAKIMKALGARDAITLDGGSSVGLAFQSKVLIRPARKLAYAIGVYVRK